ncbi:MAG: hypothetical protein IIA92_13775 [Chloroflexi bacterium]|nr:hypothetical protein [Chloroflexota bacterium]
MTTKTNQAPFKFELKLNPETGAYEGSWPEIAAGNGGGELSQVNAGGISRFEVADVPIGAAVVGMAGAGAADVVINLLEPFIPRIGLFTPGQRRGLLLLLAAWGAQWDPVKKFLSAPGADATSLLLTVDAVVTVFNARQFIAGLVTRFTPRMGPVAGSTTQAATGDVSFVNSSDAPIQGNFQGGL